MKEVSGKERNLYDLLSNQKYTIHYYQREYKWGKKQIEEMLEDLIDEFSHNYEHGHKREEVDKYGRYFMGSIVVTKDDNAIIDGQQRLTSLTLLLIYLSQLQKNFPEGQKVTGLENLIYFEKFGKKSFNINVEERNDCLQAIYNDEEYNIENEPESVKNILERYYDIKMLLDRDLITDETLPYFIDWLLNNLYLIKITAETEQDAHKIFVSMNDRGLNLTPTEMLKGFLLSEVTYNDVRNKLNDIWKEKILQLQKLGKEEDFTFIKTFLRSQYAESIRETKKNAENKDFDLIGTTFHKWVRENAKGLLKLNSSGDYESFIELNFVKYADIYTRLIEYSRNYNKDYEHVFYNANNNFTLQYQLILASICSDDSEEIVNEKIKMVSCFIDNYIARRIFNFKTTNYNTIKNAMFSLTKDIRNQSTDKLANVLINYLNTLGFSLDGIDNFFMNQFTKTYMLHILSRMTYYIEIKSGRESRFEDYISKNITNPYDIEHIFADKYEYFENEFIDENEFKIQRNRFGALILLPRDINRSLQDKLYEDKIEIYAGQNLLARSLNKLCYVNNPQFRDFIQDESLSFEFCKKFGKNEIDKRQVLYKEIALKIWNCEKISQKAEMTG